MNAETLRSHARRVAVIGSVASAQVVWSAQSAAAQAMTESSVPSGLTGPVGIVAVVLGVGGLIAGLVRRRKVAKVVKVPLPGPRQAARATVSQD
ncbi:hypothetical protein [Alloactinosynnema sp. L-07]|uniref:hypothetical protein n=1 Tax=Alloactinosynnema sp. L-07 TaxID=1653480 RepID=UPI00065EF9D8|nr:hypothetical protein [Alloactinosynnema sp. L-07]CRK59874.1 hypothetical protein [Alloactinosynnema sp. L-07]